MILNNIAPKLAPEQYERNFAEIVPRFTANQARLESARCLYCFDAPCTKACPTRIDVPAFIRKIGTGNLKGSARVILSANILGESCGRVCPTEVLCEGACVMNERGERPIEIGRLQRHAVDHVLDRHIRLFEAGAPNGRRVACIGSGPASLACASELAQRGFEVVLYDRKPLGGGLNTYGIAAYKSRLHDSLREVAMVEDLGVKIRYGVEVGGDIPLAQLEREFDAIFIGVGLGDTGSLEIPGNDLPGFMGALEFIEPTKTQPFHAIDIGRRVVVIGAGNTAIDVVTAARRLGAEHVSAVYRRGETDLSAFQYEYDLAKKDGVIFHWYAAPVRVVGQNQVEGLECVQMRILPNARPDGRAEVEPIPGSEFILPADMVVSAVGQQPLTGFLRSLPGVTLDGRRVVADPVTGQTSNPRYFAGGDCVNGGKEVVDAVAEGMRAARGIDAWISPRSTPRMQREPAGKA